VLFLGWSCHCICGVPRRQHGRAVHASWPV